MLVYLSRVNTFILEEKCLLGPPCECVYNTITCSGKNLSTIPSFSTAKEHYNSIAVSFNYNHLTTIPARAFTNLNATAARMIDIKLAWNQITSVDPAAFEGIDTVITQLDLSDNILSTVPSAISKLTALKKLSIDRNPLTSLPGTVLSAIGNTLISLSISLDLFQVWPKQISSLSKLQQLSVSGYGSSNLPMDAFSGFDVTLGSLTLQDTMLTNLPKAICTLQNAKTLTFASNHFINRSADYPCSGNGSLPLSVTTLTLSNNDLDQIPDIFTSFPAVTRLFFWDNHISTISDDSSFDGNQVVEFDLQNNSIVSVPPALNRFKKLTILRLDENLIQSIGATDFSGMTELRLLYLTKNPIQTIHPSAFLHNQHMTLIDLSNTRLNTVPVAVTSLLQLGIFRLSGGRIECSCTSMTSLKSWDVTRIHSDIGQCENSGETIKDFIKDGLQKC